MNFSKSIHVVGAHCEGEIGEVIVGGVPDVPGKTMHEKMMHFWQKQDDLRLFMLNEPRGKPSKNVNIIMPPCDPAADAGLLIMESEEWCAMSGSNTICTTTVLLETGILPMTEPVTTVKLDTPAGLVEVIAECKEGKCESVSFDNVPSFVFHLDYDIDVPGIGPLKADIAWGGTIAAIVDLSQMNATIENTNGAKLVELGERIKHAAREQVRPVPTHPENPLISGISHVIFSGELRTEPVGKSSKAATIVSPGRLDRSPCGTGTSARLAVLQARGLLDVKEQFRHISPLGTEFASYIRGTTTVGDYQAVLPTIKGRAWITSFKQVVLDPSDPFPTGFRSSDLWNVESQNSGIYKN
ncbi:proline racemase [Aspergillus steynii IBT 23096]|uniref:Proline racemase n=1 Tax=Aspergillus steynii IBT 23096 TaxID=1392250 RepID=A0A2I2GMG2_9EURO|nr:proline racemase [Aspergillus steynii IBT 23096]PLB54063.1 proline racemase [Aspergillus steynii IBT 23096]